MVRANEAARKETYSKKLDGYVYIGIGTGPREGQIKVGKSKTPYRREGVYPMKVVFISEWLTEATNYEYKLREALAEFRVCDAGSQREWFSCSPEHAISVLKSLTEVGG